MSGAPFGIYVHWPYCSRICPYCDFNIYKHKGESGDDLTDAIIRDMGYWREATGPRTAKSLHFGGGTPSLMRADQTERIIEAAGKFWDFDPDIEIALEANPADADIALWNLYAGAGINRLSLGIQSFDDAVLKFLGRDHDGTQAARALDIAVSIFPRVSADLIFGHKGQTLKDWEADIRRALSSGAGHISAYQLTIEAQTAFGRAAKRGDDKAVDGDNSAALYEHSRDMISAAGFEPYEVSNFAKPGQQSRHNKIYWQSGDYAGVGPGAHGRLTGNGDRRATVSHMTPADYIAGSMGGMSLCESEVLSPEDHAAEYLMMGLRLTAGISIKRYAEISGKPLAPQTLQGLGDMDLITVHGDALSATPDGRLLLDSLIRQLLGA